MLPIRQPVVSNFLAGDGARRSSRDTRHFLLESMMNTYECFYRGKVCTVLAPTSYAAQNTAAKELRAKKPYEIAVMLVQRADGSSVVHNPAVL